MNWLEIFYTCVTTLDDGHVQSCPVVMVLPIKTPGLNTYFFLFNARTIKIKLQKHPDI